jgi:type II secretory ATPase GspE/PulE/Tfp pilus assembly ATPase PilB-like protein
MVDVMKMPTQFGVKMTTLVKVLSEIDIAHRNNIQEGHFAARAAGQGAAGGRGGWITASAGLPLYGQKLVIRILDAANAPMHRDPQPPAWMYEQIGSAIRQTAAWCWSQARPGAVRRRRCIR